MRIRLSAFIAVLSVLPHIASGQGANPVADAFRADAKTVGKNLMDAADLMPADKFGYKPTPPQMTWAAIVKHLSGGNDLFCGAIGGVPAPQRARLDSTATKAALVGRLRETFAFCDEALSKLDDSKLGEQLTVFGQKMSRAAVMTLTTGDWADHYSQAAIYLRLNGLLPPTAKKPAS